jgi:DNA-binding NarL/FixJ family response regulator
MRLPPQRDFNRGCRSTLGTGQRSGAGQDASQPRGRSRRILLVEDEYIIAIEIEQWLLDSGHDVVGIVANAEDAVAAATGAKPDLVVMDVRLAADGDGIDAAKQILARTGIRSLFASAHSDARTRSRADMVQPLGWLTKPYSRTEFLVALDTAFGLIEG